MHGARAGIVRGVCTACARRVADRVCTGRVGVRVGVGVRVRVCVRA